MEIHITQKTKNQDVKEPQNFLNIFLVKFLFLLRFSVKLFLCLQVKFKNFKDINILNVIFNNIVVSKKSDSNSCIIKNYRF